ncbi:MAG: tetratricopeptide repeat protein, partial [Pseudomonadota bacterium]
DLSKYYHSIAQKSKKKPDYIEATYWYRVYIDSFPDDPQTAKMNFLLADIWFEIKEYRKAIAEFENTAYNYPIHDQSSEAGYAALVAYNEWLDIVDTLQNSQEIKARQIDSTFKFANNFPQHPQAPVALTKASEDLFSQKDYSKAIEASTLLVEKFPNADMELRKSAWTVKAHASFEVADYAISEQAYQQAIILTSNNKEDRQKLEDKLAASIYKQGEASKHAGNNDEAIKHFLRVGEVVPNSEIRASAQYDAAALLLQTEQWEYAASVLQDFRKRFPEHKEQSEVTRKLALAYEKDEQNLLAAQEYERISNDESNDSETRRTSALVAADIYKKEKDVVRALELYKDYIKRFPKPLEPAMEARQHLVDLYQSYHDKKQVKYWRQEIVKTEAAAGAASSDRMKYLAANASLQLAIPSYTIYQASRLKIPLEKSLKTKKILMEKALAAFELASAYKVQEVTTAATHYSALIYHDFSRALMSSDRPAGLSSDELAQYEILLEEQAFPLEEQAIELYELNANRTADGTYNKWIKLSIQELGELMPARYAKQEKSESYVESIY